jgi:predicted lipid-binding transport protein (Tim44 family)
MKRHFVRVFAVMAAVLFLSITVLELNAHARAGGSRSYGSRGSRSYSRPVSPSTQQSQSRQQYAPTPSPFQQQAGGGFMRSMAGGMMGGMLGSMLFSSFAGAGAAGMGGGGGIGLFEIALLAGIGYLIFRYIKKKRADSSSAPYDR